MRWRIPVIYQMTGIQEVEADTLAEAVAHACDNFDPCDSDFIEGSLELGCDDLDVIRRQYNYNSPDRLYDAFPELKEYEGQCFEACFPWHGDFSKSGVQEEARDNSVSWYIIVFKVFMTRYKCYLQAPSVHEALGRFFQLHPHVTYDMIIDYCAM